MPPASCVMQPNQWIQISVFIFLLFSLFFGFLFVLISLRNIRGTTQ